MPPINPKPGDTYTNQMGQNFKYGLGSNGQMMWIQQPKQNQAVMTNPDLTMQRNDGKQVLVTDPDGIQRWYDTKDDLARQRSYMEQQNKNKDAIINAYEKGIIGNNSNKEEPKKEETPKPTPKPKTNTNRGGSRTWNAGAVKQPEPTYVDQDGVTHTGMTQEEFDNSMKMYEIDNQGWYNKQRNKTIGESGMTADQMFKNAIDKFNANPDAFNDEQKKVILNAGIQLGYFNRDGSTRKDIEIPEENVQPSTAIEPTTTEANPSIATTRTSNQGSTHVGYGGSGGEGYATDNDRRMQGGANSMFWSL